MYIEPLEICFYYGVFKCTQPITRVKWSVKLSLVESFHSKGKKSFQIKHENIQMTEAISSIYGLLTGAALYY